MIGRQAPGAVGTMASEQETESGSGRRDGGFRGMGMVLFRDRCDAGGQLARLLEPLRGASPVVYAIPRGGVPVAAEVARALQAPLEVLAVRKVGAPQNPEFALGAVAEGGIHVLSRGAVRRLGLGEESLRTLLARSERELAEQIERYHPGGAGTSPRGRVAVLVDDGLATGRTALAGIRSLRARGAERVVLAVPVAAPDALAALAREADETVCVEAPPEMVAVGSWYEQFAPTSEEEVLQALAGAAGSVD
jgi:predicted phosphoribosyltransferase